MFAFLVGLLSVLLVLVSLFAILVILIQRPSDSSGFGSSLGGSAVESAFGGEASTVLTRLTVRVLTIFLTLSFLLALVHIHWRASDANRGNLPTLPQAIGDDGDR